MEFRLTYQGPLKSTQKDPVSNQADARAEHKHEIRRVFHKQLKKLWNSVPHLILGKGTGPGHLIVNSHSEMLPRTAMSLANRFEKFGYKFVPLVTEDIGLIVSLDILYIRNSKPGRIVSAGDIDNRLKTLFDALRMPHNENELGKYKAPAEDEKPFYCLLEDDDLISKVSVESDTLLGEIGNNPSQHDARLVISVKIKPHELRFDNIQFG